MLPTKQCYGVIIVFKEGENMFLLLERAETKGDYSFAKGHIEKDETPQETAMREVEEETGIKEIELLDLPLIHEEYEIVRGGERRLKMNDYFVGFVKNKEVKIEEKEIQSYKWVSYDDALCLFKHDRRRQVLKEAQKYLENLQHK